LSGGQTTRSEQYYEERCQDTTVHLDAFTALIGDALRCG
jgi:hypothetical protein